MNRNTNGNPYFCYFTLSITTRDLADITIILSGSYSTIKVVPFRELNQNFGQESSLD